MNLAVINIKTDSLIKKQAQSVSTQLGLNLSSVINAFLRQLVRTQKIEFSLEKKPSQFLLKQLKQGIEDVQTKKMSPAFRTGSDAVSWLDKQGI